MFKHCLSVFLKVNQCKKKKNLRYLYSFVMGYFCIPAAFLTSQNIAGGVSTAVCKHNYYCAEKCMPSALILAA